MIANENTKNALERNDDVLEFSDAQIEKIDDIYNAVYDLCVLMSENNTLEWNMSYIGEIADLVTDVLLDHGIPVRYPAVVSENDEPEHVQEWFMPEK